ncbi:hypothetical protein DLREEDagrD3_07900 [Denitratisoma sp. agr-D3]
MADYYLFLKPLHVTCAVISILGFFSRGLLLLSGSSLPSRPWVRRLIDSNDALLLLAAAGLSLATEQYPFVAPWVTAKVLALLLYIGLGIASFRLVASKPLRVACWLGALVVAAYIVSVALSKSPWGFLLALR